MWCGLPWLPLRKQPVRTGARLRAFKAKAFIRLMLPTKGIVVPQRIHGQHMFQKQQRKLLRKKRVRCILTAISCLQQTKTARAQRTLQEPGRIHKPNRLHGHFQRHEETLISWRMMRVQLRWNRLVQTRRRKRKTMVLQYRRKIVQLIQHRGIKSFLQFHLMHKQLSLICRKVPCSNLLLAQHGHRCIGQWEFLVVRIRWTKTVGGQRKTRHQ